MPSIKDTEIGKRWAVAVWAVDVYDHVWWLCGVCAWAVCVAACLVAVHATHGDACLT